MAPIGWLIASTSSDRQAIIAAHHLDTLTHRRVADLILSVAGDDADQSPSVVAAAHTIAHTLAASIRPARTDLDAAGVTATLVIAADIPGLVAGMRRTSRSHHGGMWALSGMGLTIMVIRDPEGWGATCDLWDRRGQRVWGRTIADAAAACLTLMMTRVEPDPWSVTQAALSLLRVTSPDVARHLHVACTGPGGHAVISDGTQRLASVHAAYSEPAMPVVTVGIRSATPTLAGPEEAATIIHRSIAIQA